MWGPEWWVSSSTVALDLLVLPTFVVKRPYVDHVIVFRSADGRWRVECTAQEMRVFEVGARRGLLLRYACRAPEELDAWLREHAGLQLADFDQD